MFCFKLQRRLESHSGDRCDTAYGKPNDKDPNQEKTATVSTHCKATDNAENKNLRSTVQPESSPCIGNANQAINCEVLIFDDKQR